jgi:hypothetical protein
MRLASLSLIVILAWLPSSIARHARVQDPDSQAPTRFSLRTLSQYNPARIGYESLPVQILSAGGGKLGPREKFRILVSLLKNRTEKNIQAIKFSCFIFRFKNWDAVVESRQTALIPLELLAFEQRKVDILVGYADDIPLLSYKPGEEFHMEVAVTEIRYYDGSVWQAKDLPQKLSVRRLHNSRSD